MDNLRLFDTHCHLEKDEGGGMRDEDKITIRTSSLRPPPSSLTEVVSRARLAGVYQMLVVAVDLVSSVKVTEIAEFYGLLAAVGIHPGSAEPPTGYLNQLRELLNHPTSVAVGEIGLDLYRDYTPLDMQITRLQQMLALAEEFDLPIILHQREAFSPLWHELERFNLPRKGVFHCWSGSIAEAELVLEAGYYISFAGNITYPKAGTLREVAAMVPPDRLLVETDAPYLSPTPHRGKRNEPVHIVATASLLAKIRGLSLAELGDITSNNAERLFRSHAR